MFPLFQSIGGFQVILASALGSVFGVAGTLILIVGVFAKIKFLVKLGLGFLGVALAGYILGLVFVVPAMPIAIAYGLWKFIPSWRARDWT